LALEPKGNKMLGNRGLDHSWSFKELQDKKVHQTQGSCPAGGLSQPIGGSSPGGSSLGLGSSNGWLLYSRNASKL
ncbi:hypothetical protein Tco_0336541, partial [Tanacetum coccineum]